MKQNPDNKNALMLKGFANFRLKKRKEAFEIYNEVLRLYENDKVQDNFSRILEEEFDISYPMIINEQRKIETLENYLLSNQIEDTIYRELGVSYYATKNFRESIKYYRIWLEKEPEDFEFWYYLGEIYEEIHNWQKAIFCYEKATQIDPVLDKGFGFGEVAEQKIKDLKKKLKRK